jgi:hypothetical protein
MLLLSNKGDSEIVLSCTGNAPLNSNETKENTTSDALENFRRNSRKF